MDDKEIAKFKEQLRLRKLGVTMYELQTILGQKISAEEKTQKANKYYKTLDNGIKQEGAILNLMYKITGQKIEPQEYIPPINAQSIPIRKNQAILNQKLQKNQKPSNQNSSKPIKSEILTTNYYLSISDITKIDDDIFFKKGRNKPVSNSIFIIKQTSNTEATLEIYKEIKTNFFNSFYRSLSNFIFAFEVVGSPSFEDNSVETIEKAKLIKEGEYWKVQQKAKIKFKKEEE